MLAFGVAAAIWQRRQTGRIARIDFSMIEAMLWTMAEPLLATQLGAPPRPVGNRSSRYVPHDAYRCLGEDDWIAIVVRNDEEWQRLCGVVPGLAAMAELRFAERVERRAAIDSALADWVGARASEDAAGALLRAGIPAAALASSVDLVNSEHLRARRFWDSHGSGLLPGLPWHASFGRSSGPAPELGADTEPSLMEVLGLSAAELAALRRSGAFGV
jgi:crotonobetainyl-CoA:carnitine CoA-transferase CaiB-like acyl-CoA transferase